MFIRWRREADEANLISSGGKHEDVYFSAAYQKGGTDHAVERRRQGDWVMQVASSSYLNFVLANGLVLLPVSINRATASGTSPTI